MSNTFLVDEIIPLTGSTVGINGVGISNVAPVANQILTTTSPTTAEWQTGVASLQTTNSNVNVSNADPPSANDVLITSTVTTTEWQSINFQLKEKCRVATTKNETLTDIITGYTVDGIVLAENDRILIWNQTTETENGIYIVQSAGAPVRSNDFLANTNQANTFVYVEEGTDNGDKGFICKNTSGSDEVNVDNIIFSVLTDYSNTSALVNNINGFIEALSSNIPYIQLAAGTYNIPNATLLSVNAGTVIEGFGIGQSIIDFSIISPTTNTIFTLGDNCQLKNLSFDFDNTDLIGFETGSNFKSINCRYENYENRGGSNSLFLIDSKTNISFKNCLFINNVFDATNGFDIINSNNINFNNCDFDNNNPLNGAMIVIDSTTDKIIISNCSFTNSSTTTVFIGGENCNCIIKNCYFSNISAGNPIVSTSKNLIMKSNIFRNNTSLNLASSSIYDANLFISSATSSLIDLTLNNTDNGFVFINNQILSDTPINYSNNLDNSLGILSKNIFNEQNTNNLPFTNLFNYSSNINSLISSISNLYVLNIATSININDNNFNGRFSVINVEKINNVNINLDFNLTNLNTLITNVGQVSFFIQTIASSSDAFVTRIIYKNNSSSPTFTTSLIGNNNFSVIVDSGNNGYIELDSFIT